MALMDEVERKRFLDTLRRDDDFRAAVRRELLTEELLNLPQTVSTLVDVTAQQRQELLNLRQAAAEQRQDFTALATDVRTYMERTITLIGDGFTAVRAEISETRAEVSELQAGFTAVRAEISETRAEVSELRDEMQAGFTAVRAGFTAVDAKFDQVNAELRVIKDQLAS